MPHAVILGARAIPHWGPAPLSRDGTSIHKVGEVAESASGWLVKSTIIVKGVASRFFCRIDRREDGLVVRLDDHTHVDRTPAIYDHLGLLARGILDANPGATLGPTNLQDHIPKAVAIQ